MVKFKAYNGMGKSEFISITIYFLIFMGTNLWLLVSLIYTIVDFFTRDIKIDMLGKVLAILAASCIALAFFPLVITFVILMINNQVSSYEYLINFTFLATLGSVLANMSIAKMQAHKEIYEEQERLGVIGSVDVVNILSLSTSFIFAGACAFFYCKRSHTS